MANPKEKWRREHSAGGVVYKDDDGIFILLIEPNKRDSTEGTGIWTFPKGVIEAKDTPEKAAVREVREEAGVAAQIEAPLGDIQYFFKWDGQGIAKTVTYFLMRHVSGEPKDDGFEVHAAKWVPMEEVMGMLARKNEREIFGKAREVLRGME